jgi:mono/diheme cytochrome c family protein
MLIRIVMVAALVASAAHAQPESEVMRGRRLAQGQCGGCHATGATDASPRLGAPPLRDLSKHFPIEDLQEALAEGIAVGHPEMPQVVWEPQDIAAFTAYLRSLPPTRSRARR